VFIQYQIVSSADTTKLRILQNTIRSVTAFQINMNNRDKLRWHN